MKTTKGLNLVCIKNSTTCCFTFKRAEKDPKILKAEGKGARVKLYPCPAATLKVLLPFKVKLSPENYHF